MIATLSSGFNRLWQRKAIRRAVQIGWIGLVALFIGIAIFANRDAIRSIEWTPERLSWIGIAIVFTLLRRLSGGLLWVAIMRTLNPELSISMRKNLKVYFVSNLATYLPGTYWFIPSRIAFNNSQGISALRTGVGALLEQFMLVLSGALVSLLGLDFVAKLLKLQVESLWWIVLVVILGLIAIHPRVVQFLTARMARLLKRPTGQLALSYTQMLLLLLRSSLIWLFGAASLVFLTKSFRPETDLSQIGVFAAIFATAWLIGFFTPFAPNGLGVREGIMALAYSAMGISGGVTALLAVLSRVLIIFEDIFWAGVSLLL